MNLTCQTRDLLALRALTLECAKEAVAWGWALIDAEHYPDGAFALTALSAPYHWSEINALVDQTTRELGLLTPADQAEATRWLAHGHLSDIVASGGEDFASLKLVSRLWFDHETPDLHIFYQLKHAIREVEAAGEQAHVAGLTRANRREMLVAEAERWLAAHPVPDPFSGAAG
ncbi:MAG: hypothetical protein CR993_03620 [Rhodobacterales bacterium]|nr:MAG: hypothetical protein CR993_03620 [Rhodobacterales bacterium]